MSGQKTPKVKNKHWTRINMEQRKYSDLEWRLNLQTLIPRDGSLYVFSLYEFLVIPTRSFFYKYIPRKVMFRSNHFFFYYSIKKRMIYW